MKLRLLFAGLTLAVACGKDSPPVAPTPPPQVSACQANNTGDLIFENRNPNNRTYTVFMDGANVGTIAPGQLTPARTVAAGVAHPVNFLYTNTTLIACTAQPIPVRCTTQTYFCTF